MKKLITLLLVLTGMVTTASAEMYLLGSGSFGGWDLTKKIAMTEGASGVYYYEFTAQSNEDLRFCFSTSNTTTSWSDFNSNSCRPSSDNTSIELGKKEGYTGGDNNGWVLTVTKGTKYLIRISTITNNQQVVVMTPSEKIYIIGSLNTSSDWNPNSGVEMDSEDFVFTKTIDAAGSKADENNVYFSFTTKLGSEWSGIAEYRFGATSDGNFVVNSSYYTGAPLTLAYWQGDSKAYQLPNGKYKLTIDFKSESLKINKLETVTTNSDGYCTYVNTEALTIPATTAYYAVDKGSGSATAHAITNPAAGTPMLIKGDESTTYYFEVASSGTTYSDNAFKAGPVTGLANTSTISDVIFYNYILNGDTFYAANGKNVGEGKAYLQLSKAATARPLIFEDEDVTGISQIENGKLKADNYFNLAGQRVAQPTKGLYIVNGKKVLVK